jgi:hypothetical protein
MEDGAQYRISYKGYLKGHNGWVTCMKSGSEKLPDGTTREFLLSGARDRSLIMWDL